MADEAPPNVRPQDLNAASQARAPRPLRLPQVLGRRPARFVSCEAERLWPEKVLPFGVGVGRPPRCLSRLRASSSAAMDSRLYRA
jgi:hypothetical protein